MTDRVIGTVCGEPFFVVRIVRPRDPESGAAEVVRNLVRPADGLAGREASLDQRIIHFYNLEQTSAVDVIEVVSGGPAYRAGLKEADRIIGVEDKVVKNVDDLHRFLAEWPIGKAVELKVLRGFSLIKLNIVPMEAL